jgi:hypothetical protein
MSRLRALRAVYKACKTLATSRSRRSQRAPVPPQIAIVAAGHATMQLHARPLAGPAPAQAGHQCAKTAFRSAALPTAAARPAPRAAPLAVQASLDSSGLTSSNSSLLGPAAPGSSGLGGSSSLGPKLNGAKPSVSIEDVPLESGVRRRRRRCGENRPHPGRWPALGWALPRHSTQSAVHPRRARRWASTTPRCRRCSRTAPGARPRTSCAPSS